MGISYSCAGSDYNSLDESLEALIMRTISFKDDDVNTGIRSLSFNGRDSENSILKAFGSGKMIIEGSLSFKGSENEHFHMGTKFSIKSPRGEKDDSARTASFKASRFKRSQETMQKTPECEQEKPKHEAAVKLQKVYKSFRTRRKLADCAVLVEQRWWKLLDFALLKRSSVSFFDIERPESVISRWSRARTRAAMVGKGLSKDEKARKLALQHWLEAIDPRHRYGHNLHFYYVSWLHCESRQPFFYWLDVGEGKEVNLEACPRPKLQQQCIKYLGPKERETYEVTVQDGKFVYKQSGQILDTSEGPKDAKWIFVLSTSRKLYVGQKCKGTFQHSSFLAGGATSAAGRLVVEKGILKAVWPHSGHYRPTEENFQELVSFLEVNNVDLTDVKKSPSEEDEEPCCRSSSTLDLRSDPSQISSTKNSTEIVTGGTDMEQKDEVQKQPHTSEVNRNQNTETKLIGPSHSSSYPELQHIPSKMLKEKSAFNRLYALCIQNLFREFEEESDEDADEKTSCAEEIKRTTSSKTSEERGCSSSSPEIQPEGNGVTSNEPSASKQHYAFQKRNLFEDDQMDDKESDVSQEQILRRINSKNGMESYQLGKQLSCKWTTGAGPRIGFVRDYPSELQFRALEQVSLSPRTAAKYKLHACLPLNFEGTTPKTPENNH